MFKNIYGIVLVALSMIAHTALSQTIDSRATAQVSIKGGSPAVVKRQLTEMLQLKAVSNVLETSFGIKITPDVQAKIPKLVETLGNAIRISFDPPDGEVLSGSATIRLETAKLNEILNNLEIGSGAQAQKAKVLVSIDERMGLATANDSSKPIETQVDYAHDKSSFSDTSAKASSSNSQSSAYAASSQKDIGYSNKQAVAVSGSQSSASAARQDTAIAGRRDTAVAYQGVNGQAAGASSTQIAGAQSTQYASANKSQYAGASSSSTEFADKSKSAVASSSASSSSSSSDQKNIQQQNDKVNLSVRTKMADFDNSKISNQDNLIVARLAGEFIRNGLEMVTENDLRAEGGRILPVEEIVRNGRLSQFTELINKKGLNADVWARGTAKYNIVGTDATGTKCNGQLDIQASFLQDNTTLMAEAIRADAAGNGDQDCRANLALSMATALAQKLGTQANKKFNAMSKADAKKVVSYKLFVYTKGELTRRDRNTFTDMLKTLDGLQTIGDSESQPQFMSVEVTYPRALKSDIEKLLDKLPWDKADVVGPKNNKICIGLEGMSSCPNDFR